MWQTLDVHNKVDRGKRIKLKVKEMDTSILERQKWEHDKERLNKYKLRWDKFNWIDMLIFGIAFAIGYFLLR